LWQKWHNFWVNNGWHMAISRPVLNILSSV
jgi:hypothetical protein